MGTSSATGAGYAAGAATGAMGIALVVMFAMMAFAMLLFIWWLVRLIEAVRIPESAWAYADQSKTVAVLLMVLLGLLGTFVYSLAMRPKLKSAGVLGRR